MRSLLIILVALVGMSATGCSRWQFVKSYHQDDHVRTSVGDPMVFEELFAERRLTKARLSGRGARAELIYTGRSGSTIAITYREYVNDWARPAFFQDLKYDLSSSDIVVFRRVRLKVVDANNEFIDFEVLDASSLAPNVVVQPN